MQQDYDVAAIMGALYGEGIVGLNAGFPREFVESLHRQCLALSHRRWLWGPASAGTTQWHLVHLICASAS